MTLIPCRASSFNWPTVVVSQSMLCRTRDFSVRNSNDLTIRIVRVAFVLGTASLVSGSEVSFDICEFVEKAVGGAKGRVATIHLTSNADHRRGQS